VNLGRTDSWFVLPRVPGSCVVLEGLDDWTESLGAAGVTVRDSAAGNPPDLAVAPASATDGAIATGASMIILEGSGGERALRGAGYQVRRYIVRPTRTDPALLFGLRHRRAAATAVATWTTSDRRWRQARNTLARTALAAGVAPTLGPVTTIAARTPGPPFALTAAERFGVPPGAEWYLTSGRGDQLSRNVFHVLAHGARTPAWVVKFARVPGYSDPFDRDERGLTVAQGAGGVVAAHAPRLLGRYSVGGLHASVESAATGARLTRLLREPGGRARKLAIVDAIAAWSVDVGRSTATGDALGPELGRLTHDVLPHWTAMGADRDLTARLPPLPAVLQHNDLGSWNIVADRHDFTAVDWESARPAGLPLWDLVYFLTDALARLDGVSHADQDAYAARLFLGQLPNSAVLFRWVREGAAATGVPPAAVGPIVTLCWLHHGTSHVRRAGAIGRFAPESAAGVPAIERMATVWLREPGLGSDWSAWRAP
jgi:hypothetical protein